jgi:uncharacterized membrane protein YdbT with pleckstrin-like domain
MRYVEKILQPDETVVDVTGLHWFVYLPALALLVVALGLTVLANYVASNSNLAMAMLIAAAAVSLLAAIAWLRGFLRRYGTELAVTNRRVIFKRGLLRRHTIEMNMSKVESVDVDQSITGRVFGYGTVTIRGTGGGIEPLRNIRDPLAFRNHVTAS